MQEILLQLQWKYKGNDNCPPNREILIIIFVSTPGKFLEARRTIPSPMISLPPSLLDRKQNKLTLDTEHLYVCVTTKDTKGHDINHISSQPRAEIFNFQSLDSVSNAYYHYWNNFLYINTKYVSLDCLLKDLQPTNLKLEIS